MANRLPVLAMLVACVIVPIGLGVAVAAPSASPSASASASSAVELPDPATLPPLPTLEPIRPVESDAASDKELESLLSQLVSEKEDIRDHARAAIKDVPPTLVGAIHARIEEIRGAIDRTAAPLLLEQARKVAKQKRKAMAADPSPKDDPAPDGKTPKKRKKGKKGKDDDGPKEKPPEVADEDGDLNDWLPIVLDQGKTEKEAWKHLVELLAMERMLTAIGTTPAVRELLALRAGFGKMLELDIKRQVMVLGDKAVAALIEARKHDASVVRTLAEDLLDKLGRSLPGAAVASEDPDILSDVLRAFGRVRDVDAVHVALSFANSDRRKIRDAAREAIVGIGDAGKWQLREAYQDLTGEKPEPKTPWETLAKQIFGIYDRARLAAFSKLVSDGMTAQKDGKDAEAVVAFDRILAEDPLFQDRASMAPSYVKTALALPPEKNEERLAMLRKAQRLDPGGKDDKHIESLIALTEAKLLIDDRRPDKFLLERAVELDPTNQEAKDLLASFETKAIEQKQSDKKRFFVAGGIFAAMIVGMLVVGLVGRKKKKPDGAPKAAGNPAAPPGPVTAGVPGAVTSGADGPSFPAPTGDAVQPVAAAPAPTEREPRA